VMNQVRGMAVLLVLVVTVTQDARTSSALEVKAYAGGHDDSSDTCRWSTSAGYRGRG